MNGPEILIPLSAIFLIFGIPIVAIWTTHRQKMATLELSMRQQGLSDDAAIRALKSEVTELRERVNEQALVVESMRDLVRGMANRPTQSEGETVQQRINS